MEKRTNIGYEIIECIELGGVEYVLGVNETELLLLGPLYEQPFGCEKRLV